MAYNTMKRFTTRRRYVTRKPTRYGRKPVGTTYRKRSLVAKFKRTPPSRYISSKRQYMTTRTMTKKLAQVAETFYNPLAVVDDVAISTVTSGSTQVCFKGMTLGETVPSHLSGYTALNGMDFSTAVGKYCYIKRAQALMTLESDPTGS